MFLGFANFYYKFIKEYLQVVTGLINITKGQPQGKRPKKIKKEETYNNLNFILTSNALHAFNKLKKRF